jgi:hypothetical protein
MIARGSRAGWRTITQSASDTTYVAFSYTVEVFARFLTAVTWQICCHHEEIATLFTITTFLTAITRRICCHHEEIATSVEHPIGAIVAIATFLTATGRQICCHQEEIATLFTHPFDAFFAILVTTFLTAFARQICCHHEEIATFVEHPFSVTSITARVIVAVTRQDCCDREEIATHVKHPFNAIVAALEIITSEAKFHGHHGKAAFFIAARFNSINAAAVAILCRHLLEIALARVSMLHALPLSICGWRKLFGATNLLARRRQPTAIQRQKEQKR